MAPEGAVHRERSQWFLQSASFLLTVLLVERSEPRTMCYTIAARPQQGEASHTAEIQCTLYTVVRCFLDFVPEYDVKPCWTFVFL
jgi:hypothetical protein